MRISGILLIIIFAGSLHASPWSTHSDEGTEHLHTSAGGGAPAVAGELLVRAFQKGISPQDGPNCRFHPVCSHYGRESVQRFGLLRGGFMAGDRLLRCNPYSHESHDDPVPPAPCGAP